MHLNGLLKILLHFFPFFHEISAISWSYSFPSAESESRPTSHKSDWSESKSTSPLRGPWSVQLPINAENLHRDRLVDIYI